MQKSACQLCLYAKTYKNLNKIWYRYRIELGKGHILSFVKAKVVEIGQTDERSHSQKASILIK